MSWAKIGILYEHPDWFKPLFAELDRRGLAYAPVLADKLRFDPAADAEPYALVVNRMSPSAYLRGHRRAIFAAQHYLTHLARLGVPTINGLDAFTLELSKSRQLEVLAELGLRAPATRVVDDPAAVPSAAAELEFPIIVKPNVGGSGALMRSFDSAQALREATLDGELDGAFEIDGTALVQEYHPPRGGSIVRVEVLDGDFLYAIRIENDPSQGFNLCPADICQVPANGSTGSADFDLCPLDVAVTPARKILAEQPPDRVVSSVLRIAAHAGLDLGGVEYLESERDGQLYFYDINALSNFVADAPRVVGFDPFVPLGELIARRYETAISTVGDGWPVSTTRRG
jgi:glutathione synthase/RimK-type ligase-like ATP-grasp enzyme